MLGSAVSDGWLGAVPPGLLVTAGARPGRRWGSAQSTDSAALTSARLRRILGHVAKPRLVFLYGPPAVGKLTVARAITDRLPFKILHNHVTIDAVTEVLPFGSATFWRVVGRFRRDLVAAAAEENVDLIYTYVFAPGDEQHVADIVSSYEQAGGAVSFVQLLAPREVLLQRVLDESRREYGKPTDVETLLAHARRVRQLHGARSDRQSDD